MLLTLAIIIALLAWGLTDFLAARAARQAPALTLAAWTPLASIPVAIIAALAGADLSINWKIIGLALLSIALLATVKIYFYRAAQQQETTAVVAYLAAYPLIAMLILSALDTRLPEISALLGMAIIIIGIIYLPAGRRLAMPNQVSALGLAITAIFGAWAVVESLALRIADPLQMLFWVAALYSLMTPILLLGAKRRKLPLRLSRRPLQLIFANQWIGYLGLLSFYYALKLGNDILVIALTSLTPLVTGWICILIAEERFQRRRIGATAMIISGALLVRGLV